MAKLAMPARNNEILVIEYLWQNYTGILTQKKLAY